MLWPLLFYSDSFFFFFFNDTATTEIYTLSLHDALPISYLTGCLQARPSRLSIPCCARSEEHTSELQSHSDLVCRLLLEKKKKQTNKSSSMKKTKQQTSRLHQNLHA